MVKVTITGKMAHYFEALKIGDFFTLGDKIVCMKTSVHEINNSYKFNDSEGYITVKPNTSIGKLKCVSMDFTRV